MRTNRRKTRKTGGWIALVGVLAVLVVLAVVLLTQCDVVRPGSIRGDQLAQLLAEPGDKVITLDGDVVITEPLTVVGNKTIEGNGTIILDVALEGTWPESDAPSWGMGCAKLSPEDAAQMAAAISLDKKASLTLGGSVVVDAKENANGIVLGDKSEFTVTGSATVKNGRYANLVIGKTATANLSAGQLLDGKAYNVINYGTVLLTGTTVSGAEAGAVLYTTGTAEQSGGKVEGASFHNVYVAAGSFRMTGGENTGAEKDGLVIAQGASAEVTGGDISACIHGLCNNGTAKAGAVTLTECGIMNTQTGQLELEGTTVDTSEVYCLSNNGGKVAGTDVTFKRCDTVAVYNFTGDMLLKNLKIEGSRDGNIANAGGTLTVEGGVLGICRDKSITVGNGVATFNNVVLEGTNREKYGVYAYGGQLYMNSCSISNISSTAVKVDAGATVELNDVDIKDAEQNGFQLDGGRIVANNVSMENMGSHGVYNKGGELIADVLSIKNVDKNAIQNLSGDATVKNLVADTMGNHGAYVEAGVLTIEDGTVANAEANGFYLPEGGGRLVLKNVKISVTGQQGINNSSVVDAENITITGTGMNGIYNKAGATMTVNGANIHDVAEHGINNKSVMTITDLTVTNSGADSNSLQNNGTMTVKGAKLSGSKNHGLYNTGSLTAADVTITGTAKNGVYNDTDGTIQAEKLTVTATGEHGINNAAGMTAEGVKISDTGAGKNSIQNSGTITLTDCEISDSRNHGIYNTGVLQGENLTITHVADNGIYNNKGQITGITGLSVSATGGQGINNTGSLTASDVQVSGTGKNGVYTNGGVTGITGLTVTDPGEHGISNDYNGIVTLTDAVLDGSAAGSNCIQNKATMHLQDVVVKNSSNHGIYNDDALTSGGLLSVNGAAVNGIYNYGGTVELSQVTIQGAGEHGINNAGTMTVKVAQISGVTSNGIQNTKELTVTGSVTITDSGKHGIYNGKLLEAANVTVTNTGDLLLSNAGDMVIRGLKLTGKAQKAIYNAGYAELYNVTVDGTQIRNQTDATAQYLVDNNAGVLDLTDSTIVDAWGTALHVRANGAVSVTNVVIDGAGNYGIFIGGGSKLSGDGLVINNVTKNADVSGAEGFGIKTQGNVTMMDHVFLGLYSDTVTGDGITSRKSTGGIASAGMTVDATTASYSGLDLNISNCPNSNGIYNKGRLEVTDLTVDNVKDALVCRYEGWATLSGKVKLTNVVRNPISVYGAEGKTYRNGVTLISGAELTIDTAGSHGINNKGTFEAQDGTRITIRNITGKNINAINNNGGSMTLDDVTVDGLYVTISKNGDIINTNSGNALQTNNKLVLNGNVVLQNMFYKPEGGLTDNSNGSGLVVKGNGVVTGTGSLTVIGNQTAPAAYEGYKGLYNGIYNEKRNITLSGDVTIRGAANRGIELTTGTIDVGDLTITDIGKRGVNIYGNGKLYAKSLYIDGTVENGIQNNPGTIEIDGAAVIKNVTGAAHGIYNNGTFKAASLEISNVTKNGVNNAATMNITGLLKVTNAVEAGVASTKTLTAGSVVIDTVTNGHGINNNNAFTVTGDITITNTAKRGINNYNSGNLSAANITITSFGESGIQNAATLTASGAIVIKDNTNKGHGVYNTKNLTAGSLTIQNIVRKGLSNDGGTVIIHGALTVDTVREEAILNNGTVTVNGFTTVKNVTGTDINAVHNKSGKTLSLLGGGLITDVKVTAGDDKTYVGNGIYTEGEVILGGTVTVTKLYTNRKDNSIGCGAIAYKGGVISGSGNLVIEGTESTDTLYAYGIGNGIFLNGDAATPSIRLTGDITVRNALTQGIYLANEVLDDNGAVTSTAKLTARNITVSGAAGNGIYNRAASNELIATGTITVTDAGQHALNNSGILTAGAVTVKNAGKNGINNNGGTMTVSGAVTVDTAAEHAVSNNKLLSAASVSITNAGTSAGNGIQNSGNGEFTVSGAVVIDGVKNGHGIYNAKTVHFGSFAVQNTGKNGVNNGGTMTVTGTLKVTNATADGVANSKILTAGAVEVDRVATGAGIKNSGTQFTVTGTTQVRNVLGSNVNGLQNTGTMTLGTLIIDQINTTISSDKFGNGLFNSGTLTLNGDVSISNVTTSSNTSDLKCHGILNYKTILCNGAITIHVNTTGRGGIHMVGGKITGDQASLRIVNTQKTLIRMTSGAKIDVKEIYCANGKDQGIQLDDGCTLTAANVVVDTVPENALRLKNDNAQPTVRITNLVCLNISNYAIAANKAATEDVLQVTNLYYESCTNLLHSRIPAACVTNIIAGNPLATAVAGDILQ